MTQQNSHKTVFLEEAVKQLLIEPDKWYIDATFGQGGHTAAILQSGGKVLAFDWDREAISAGEKHFKEAIVNNSLILLRESFSQIKQAIKQLKGSPISGILFDFGTSTNQLMSGERGFSFAEDGELDMRMDDRLGVKAKDILAVVPEKQLADLFWQYGGEEQSKRIAKAIKQSKQSITSTQQLANLIEQIKHGGRGRLHPATKVFQALRIAVNSELTEIESALPQALEVLESQGKIVTISFHEGEDRIVKHLFQTWDDQGKGEQLTKKPINPTDEEIATNPRSRSAKLRVFRKK